MLVGALIGLIIPLAVNHMVAKDSFVAAFQVGEWWKVLRANFRAHVLAYLVYLSLAYGAFGLLYLLLMPLSLCAGLVMSLLGMIFFFYWLLVGANLFAQIYREGVQKLAVT